MNDHDPENLPAVDRKPKTSQATIAMPNGSHQQRGQHTRGTPPSHALAPLCAKPILDTGACLIDDFHARTQTVCWCDTTDGLIRQRTLDHEHDDVRGFYAQFSVPATIGLEATGYARWFHRLLE